MRGEIITALKQLEAESTAMERLPPKRGPRLRSLDKEALKAGRPKRRLEPASTRRDAAFAVSEYPFGERGLAGNGPLGVLVHSGTGRSRTATRNGARLCRRSERNRAAVIADLWAIPVCAAGR